MINIYDTANQMEQDLRKTSQYQELQTAYEALKADETALSVSMRFILCKKNFKKANVWTKAD